MNSLFGVDLPTPVNFVIAFVVVLLLIGAATWLVRRFGATRLDAAARSRQPRLAVVDAAAVDGRRKLVIIRRDNVEHLLMIGGPTDVVVETNIVRAAVAGRDTAAGRNGHALPEPGPAPWPEPTPAPPPMAARAVPRMAVEDSWQPTSDAVSQPVAPTPPMRAVRPADTLASLAHELGRAAPEPQPPPRPVVVETPAPPPAPAPVPAPAAPQAAGPDQSLAEMAQRLEAALRRPKPVAAAAPPAPPAAEVKAPVRQPRVVVAPKGGAQPAAAVQPQNNLEQEMASLLNKPGKT
jgi:flagellar protein FliO/FliZ